METTITKYLEGKASDQEMLKLANWLEDKENQESFKRVKNSWKASLKDQQLSPSTLRELSRFQSRILDASEGKLIKLNHLHRLYKYVAIFLLLFAIGSVIVNFQKSISIDAASYNTIFAEKGQIAKVLLPDSSVVWLNSGSSLKYSNHFGFNKRDIILRGQAYFDVTKNRKFPFVVNCEEFRVKVLGTRFSVEAYPDNPTTNVVLEEGAVELLPQHGDEAFARLQPNDMLVYQNEERHFKINEVHAEKYTAWRKGTINFFDQPLKYVVPKLVRRFNQPIELEKELENYKVTFSIVNENFEDVLTLLLEIAPAAVYQEGGVIHLKKK